MVLAIINGIITSIILETIILLRQNFSLKLAFKTAVGMSLISMVSMEIAMNATDYFLNRRSYFNLVGCANNVSCWFCYALAI